MSAKGTSAGQSGDNSRLRRSAVRLLWAVVSALLLIASSQNSGQAGVLDESDLARIAQIKPSFIEVVTDVSQSAQRPDLSSGDSECIKSTLRALMQIFEEFRTYEYLITIEGELNDFGDDQTLRSVLRFAVENALKFLANERRRMGELSEQCSRYQVSAGKTKQVIQFIEGTAAILRSIRPRL